MTSRTWMIFGLTALWFWACQYWYTCPIKEVGYSCKKEIAKTVPQKPNDDGPLLFAWEDATPITNEKFQQLKNEILNDQSEDNILVIAGPYTKSEDNTSTFDNIGLARASMIKELFLDEMPSKRIKITSTKLTEKKKMRRGTWAGATFRWKEGKKVEKVEDSGAGKVVELDDKALIYFPYNSVEKTASPRIDEYLTELAKRLKASKEKVVLTGHTDSQGAASGNEKLGLRRAKMIRDILKEKGIKANKIITRTEGEKNPIATNDTELGRIENRRVVVQIIK